MSVGVARCNSLTTSIDRAARARSAAGAPPTALIYDGVTIYQVGYSVARTKARNDRVRVDSAGIAKRPLLVLSVVPS